MNETLTVGQKLGRLQDLLEAAIERLIVTECPDNIPQFLANELDTDLSELRELGVELYWDSYNGDEEGDEEYGY